MTSLFSLKKSMAAMAVAVCGVASAWAAPDGNDPYAGQYDVLTVPQHAANAYRQGELIVKLRTENVATPIRLKGSKGKVKANASAKELNALISKYGLEEAEELMPLTGSMVTPKARRAKSLNGKEMSDCDLSSLYVLRFDAQKAADIRTVAEEFSALDEVDYAEPNYIVYACSTGTAADYTSDPMYTQQWGISAINLDKLWDKPIINTKRPVIAILDTGVDIEHPDLAENIWTNELETKGADDYDDDANGFVDDVHGWDFINQTSRIRDNNGHGTHCAGIAAAVGGNGIGITGANPDALIMPITILQSDGTGDVGTIIKGVDYAVANGADVISMSFTGASGNAMYDALSKAYQKAVLVAAAGNDGLDIMCTLPDGRRFPAAYNFVIGVMATTENGQLASFSMTDINGPVVSYPWESENYEVAAPGTNILSTYPGGGYKNLNGTSMSCPLVAGAISRLYQCKDIANQEILFGDLIHSLQNGFCSPLDFEVAYNITNENRSPELYYLSYRMDDSEGDGDLRPDAGEIINLYVSLRNSWGNAKNIKLHLELGENEDPEIVEFIEPTVDFGHSLSGYARNESRNPLRFKISDKCTDTRHIRLVLTATCDGGAKDIREELTIIAENGIELGGIIAEDLTLYPDKYYIVTRNLGIPDGVTLTLMPGTKLYFHDMNGISVSENGSLIAKGTPDNRIYFLAMGRQGDGELSLIGKSELEYCVFDNLNLKKLETTTNFRKNIIQYCRNVNYSCLRGVRGSFNLFTRNNAHGSIDGNLENSTIVYNQDISGENLKNCNLINNYYINGNWEEQIRILSPGSSVPTIVKIRVYPGSAREDIYSYWIHDIKYPFGSQTFAEISRKDLLTEPHPAAPGCVWKVLVDGVDAQDERELLSDLGVGRHKFDIYFSKEMRHDFTPEVTMGVRAPYTQVAIQEDGYWHTETHKRNFTIDDVYWKLEDSNCYYGGAYIDTDGILHGPVFPTNSDTMVYYGEVADQTLKIKVNLFDVPALYINKKNEYLVTGETTQLTIKQYGEEYSCDWISSDESVVTVDSHGIVTAKGPGTAIVTPKDNTQVYTTVSVFDKELPEGIYLLQDEFPLDAVQKIDLSNFIKISPITYAFDVYTVWHTIRGRDNYDGLNRIMITGAYDSENFPCPIENWRFNVNVQSAGSMSAGFTAEAGVGKVALMWDNPGENLDDLLGYNMYRYTLGENDLPNDTIQINKELIDKEEFVDYDVTPGTTYCYYYKMLRTSLDESSMSKVVSATPYASRKGDSNGSGSVDVADVITDVNYMVGRDPKPFIFDAADVNDDSDIDILDVVGTVNIIMAPAGVNDMASAMSVATYTIEDGILYVDCPVELAGVQAELNGMRGTTEIAVLPALHGMENTGDWVSDRAYRFVAFSLSGKTLDAGRHGLLSIGDAGLANLILVDVTGKRIMAINGSTSGIGDAVMQQMKTPTPNPFVDVINVPVIIGTDGNHDVELSIHDLSGAKVLSHRAALGYGEHNVTLNAGHLNSGFYMLTLTVDGAAVQTHKVIKK